MTTLPEEIFLDPDNLDDDKFLEIFSDFQPSSGDENLFLNVTEEHLDNFWNKVLELTTFNSFLVLNLEISINGDHPNKEDLEKSEKIICAITKLAIHCCSLKSCQHLDGFNKTAIVLHGLLLQFGKGQEDSRNAVVQLCEAAWAHNLPRKSEFALNAIQYLLAQTLLPNAIKNSVSRVYSMKECLTNILKQKNESSKAIWNMVESCFTCNVYFEAEKGVKFLTWVVVQDVGLFRIAHQNIKRYLMDCPTKYADSLGAVYFKSWSQSNQESRKKLERDVFEDLINTTMLFDRKKSRSMFAKLLKILNCIHKQKKNRDVAVMLFTLYDVVIWRSLKVPNADVRGNTAHILFDCYPLKNPDLNLEQDEFAINQQYNEMKNLLLDPAPEVRCIAARGVFSVMHSCWDTLPQQVIKDWLTVLLKQCLWDSHSAPLRVAVVKGLMDLLENALTHTTIKALLPLLKNSFHDVSENVRHTVCLFLMKLNTIEGFLYWDVVPIEHLLSRLEIDTDAMRENIVQLTCKNFFPVNKSLKRMLERSFHLFRTNPVASRIYVRHWSLMVDIKDVVSYMKAWNKSLLILVAQNNRETSENAVEATILEDPILVASILDSLFLTWKTVNHVLILPENKELRKDLFSEFERIIPKLFNLYKEREPLVRNPLLLLASALRLKSMITLHGYNTSRLAALTEESADYPEDFHLIVDSLFNLGRERQLLETLLRWIVEGFLPEPGENPHRNPLTSVNCGSAQNKRSRKRVNFEKDPPKPCLAVAIFKYILNLSDLQFVLFSRNRQYILDEILPVFERTKNVAVNFLQNEDPVGVPLETLTETFSIYCQMTVLLLDKKDESTDLDVIRKMEGLLFWATETLIPVLATGTSPVDILPVDIEEPKQEAEAEENIPQQQQRTGKRKKRNRKFNAGVSVLEEQNAFSLAHSLMKVVLVVTSDMILVDWVDEEFLTTMCTFLATLVKQEYGNPFLSLVCRDLSLIVDHMGSKQIRPSEASVSLLSELFSAVFKQLLPGDNNNQQIRELLGSCQKPLVQSIQTLFTHFRSSKTFMDEMMALLLATLLGDATKHIQMMKETLKKVSQLEELPSLSSLILKSLIGPSQSDNLFESVTFYLNLGMTRPIKMLALIFTLYHASKVMAEAGRKSGSLTEAVQTAEPILQQMATEVKAQLGDAENLQDIPDVIYCKCSFKLLKKINQK